MLAGKPPYDADTPYAVIHDHIFSPLPLPSQFKPDIPEAVERVVLKALAKGRNDRFQSVTEMMSALEEGTLEEGMEAKPEVEAEMVPPPTPELGEGEAVEEAEEIEPVEKASSRWRSRRFILSIAGLGAVLSLCLCFLLFVFLSGMLEERETPLHPQEIVAAIPEDPAAHIHLAELYFEQGNIDQAVAQYEIAIQLDPEAVEAYIGLGFVYLEHGNPELAVDGFVRALEIEPDNVEAHLGMADAFFFLEDYGSAARHYQRAVELDPDLPGPRARLGIYHIMQGDVERGLAECERALQSDPRMPEGHFCLGLYFAEQGDIEGARREFEIVVETGPPILADRARRQLDRLE
jgi:Tfp pilus assembly protein PilF